ncbi:MAG: spermidine synthase [Acidobacteriota bacterium]
MRELFLVSVATLFFELFAIRWLSSQFRSLAYMQNFILVGCFLGLGIGFSWTARRSYFFLFPVLLAVFLALVSFGEAPLKLIRVPTADDFLIWVGRGGRNLSVFLTYYSTLLFFFALIAAMFLPLGQKMGRLMEGLPRLRAYSVNIAGSLVGILLFTLVCFRFHGPLWWFLTGALAAVPIFWNRRLRWLGLGVLACGILCLWPRENVIWSPYYKIEINRLESLRVGSELVDLGYSLEVNHNYHQRMLNLSPEMQRLYGRQPTVQRFVQHYEYPYQFVSGPQRVLILGAGSGNDAAAALRHKVPEIHAVEIDPVIARMGRELHPERPYLQAAVRVFVQDARQFVKHAEDKYDLVVMALLDSQTLVSGMNSVRLDNFVYTREAFQEVRRILKPGGTLSLSFATSQPWLREKIIELLRSAFGVAPLVMRSTYDNSMFFIVGPHSEAAVFAGTPGGMQRVTDPETLRVDTPTDDWPQLYLRVHKIPRLYLIGIVLLLVASSAAVLALVPASRRIRPTFFFLGAAFLLVEVKTITELSLAFGSTWVTNAFAISGILIMILAANFLVGRFPRWPLGATYLVLIATLLAQNRLDVSRFLNWPAPWGGVVVVLLLSLPILFAGILFARQLEDYPAIAQAMGSNLMGTMLGGFSEYLSLQFGIKFLYLVAAGFYALAGVFRRK